MGQGEIVGLQYLGALYQDGIGKGPPAKNGFILRECSVILTVINRDIQSNVHRIFHEGLVSGSPTRLAGRFNVHVKTSLLDMRQSGPPQSRNGFGALCIEVNPGRFRLLKPICIVGSTVHLPWPTGITRV
jgi:hypothetical protein